MNSRQLYLILQSKVDNFCGVFPADKVPKKLSKFPVCLVVNTDPSSQPGTHWLAAYIDSMGRGEQFDSFGRVPAKNSPLSQLLTASCGSKWHYNEERIQEYCSSVCGHYCIYFLLQRNRGVPMSEIIRVFSERDYAENDSLITDWVNDHFDIDTDTYNLDFILNQVCRALLSTAE